MIEAVGHRHLPSYFRAPSTGCSPWAGASSCRRSPCRTRSTGPSPAGLGLDPQTHLPGGYLPSLVAAAGAMAAATRLNLVPGYRQPVCAHPGALARNLSSPGARRCWYPRLRRDLPAPLDLLFQRYWCEAGFPHSGWCATTTWCWRAWASRWRRVDAARRTGHHPGQFRPLPGGLVHLCVLGAAAGYIRSRPPRPASCRWPCTWRWSVSPGGGATPARLPAVFSGCASTASTCTPAPSALRTPVLSCCCRRSGCSSFGRSSPPCTTRSAWLSGRPLVAPRLGAIGGPLAYWAGVRLGAAGFGPDLGRSLVQIGIGWALAMVVLLAAHPHRAGSGPAHLPLFTRPRLNPGAGHRKKTPDHY